MLRLVNAGVTISKGNSLFSSLNLALNPGDQLQIIGPNGVGKSTLLKAIAGYRELSSGQRLADKTIKIAYLPQLANINFHIPLTLKDVLDLHLSKQVSLETMLSLGFLDEKQLSLSWNTASGGERQKVLLTRIFLEPANLLLLDEPCNHLDFETSQMVILLMKSFVQITSEQRAIVFISHQNFDSLIPTKKIELGAYPN